MNDLSGRLPGRLEIAEQRLAKAIGRLEGALESQVLAAPPKDAGLAHDLSRLQIEHAALKGLVGQASTRLEGTIAQLKQQMVKEA